MSSKTVLSLPLGGHLAEVSPGLMPFRISYSGPAPISTYFLRRAYVDAGRSNSKAKTGVSGDSNEGEVVSDNATEQVPGKSENVEDSTHDRSLSSAAFRGRRIIGHSVPLPVGYAGLVLTQKSGISSSKSGTAKGTEAGKAISTKPGDRMNALKAKAAAKLKAKSKGGRKTRQTAEVDEANTDEMEPEDDPVVLEDDPIAQTEEDALVGNKIFEPTGRFQTFTLWSPDRPGELSSDEYVRSLKEWTMLAEVIHRV